MSFSSDVKAELCRSKTDRKCCAVAECYGVLLYCNTFTASEIRIITASPDFASRLPKLFHRAFNIGFDVLPKDDAAGKRTLLITDTSKIARIYEAFGLDADSTPVPHVNFGVLEEDCCQGAFIRGAFLAGGSVTDPQKRNHLELGTQHRSVSREVCSILLDMGFSPKETTRNNTALLYFKRSEQISDFITRIGAPASALNVMSARIDKEVSNNVSRQINCAFANADKTVTAAQEQIKAIKFIMNNYSLDILPEPLKDAALLRAANPEASLAELSMLSYPHVTKSCLSHRLKKIMEYVPQQDEE